MLFLLKSKSSSATSKAFQSGFRLFWMGQEFVNRKKYFFGPHLDSFGSLDKFWWPTFCDKEEDEEWIRLGEPVLIWQASSPKGEGHCHFDLSLPHLLK